MRSDNHSFLKNLENIKLLKAWCQETDEDVCGNNEHFPASHSICQNELKIQTKHVTPLFLSFFDFWKAKIRCLILSSSNIFLVLLHSFNPNAKKSDYTVFCYFYHRFFITYIFCSTQAPLFCECPIPCLTVIQTFVSSEHLRRCTQLATPKTVIKGVFLINLWPSCTKI